MASDTINRATSLLPCPFCGAAVTLEEAQGTQRPERRFWGVVCRGTANRGGTCAIQQRPSASPEAAIERWNRRATPTPNELSPEFTDTARAALLWVLWHHQGASSPVGQPIRFALGMGQHDRLEPHQLVEAKRWERLHPVNPSVWAPKVRPLTPEQIAEIWVEHGLDDCDPEGFARRIEAAHGITGAPDGHQQT